MLSCCLQTGRLQPRERPHLHIAEKLCVSETTDQAQFVFGISITDFTTHRSCSKLQRCQLSATPPPSRNSRESRSKASSRSEAKICFVYEPHNRQEPKVRDPKSFQPPRTSLELRFRIEAVALEEWGEEMELYSERTYTSAAVPTVGRKDG